MIRTLIILAHDTDTINTFNQRANNILVGFTLNPENHDELKALAQQYITASPQERFVEEEKLKPILAKLREDKKITESQAEAFLCTSVSSVVLQDLQALVLLAALEHKNLFGNAGRPLRAMAAFRLLAEDRAKNKKRLSSLEIEQLLPATSQTLDSFVKNIDRIFSSLTDSSLDYAHQRLMPLRRILKDVIAQSLENQRKRRKAANDNSLHTDRSVGSGDEMTTYPEQVLVRDVPETEETSGYQELSVQLTTLDETQNTLEHVVDNQATGLFLATQPEKSAPASLRRSHALSAMHAKTVAGSIERREKRLICLTNRLTRYETEILIAELKHRMPESDVAYLLYLALATGRRPKTLLEAKEIKSYKSFKEAGSAYSLGQQDLFLLYRQELPAHRVPDKQTVLLNQRSAPVVLPVPCGAEVVRPLLKTCGQDFELQAEALLKEINKANSTKLSIGKITDHLANFLHHHGVDDVLIALLTGNPNLQEAGLYYSQYDTVSLYRAYQLYREEMLQAETQDPIESNAEHGGSQLVLTEDAVTGIFDHLKRHLHKEQVCGWDRVHNSFVMYTLHLLNIATGHRPVRDPFDDIDHIDLISKKIFISDKESRFTASSARTLVLPDTAVGQIKIYTEHLERLYIHMQSLSPGFAQQIGDTLKGEGPLLFLIDRESTVDNIKMISVSPKDVDSFWAGILDLPTNWNRHFLRTYLLRQSIVPGEAIDTWMGHAGPGQEGLTKYSGMSLKTMGSIASQIDNLFRMLKVTPLTSQGLIHG